MWGTIQAKHTIKNTPLYTNLHYNTASVENLNGEWMELILREIIAKRLFYAILKLSAIDVHFRMCYTAFNGFISFKTIICKIYLNSSNGKMVIFEETNVGNVSYKYVWYESYLRGNWKLLLLMCIRHISNNLYQFIMQLTN